MKYISNLIAAFTCFAGLCGCGIVEFEHSENGDLDGYWHLSGIDTLATGGHLDLSEERVFWAVQGNLLTTYSPDMPGLPRYVFHFAAAGGVFSILESRVFNRSDGDPLVENVEVLAPFGINRLDEEFTIEELSGSRLQLRSDLLRLNFRKQ